MFKTASEAVNLVQTLKAGISKATDCDVVVIPPFTALFAVSKALEDASIELGAQNMFHEAEGAYTGEISAKMILSAGYRIYHLKMHGKYMHGL